MFEKMYTDGHAIYTTPHILHRHTHKIPYIRHAHHTHINIIFLLLVVTDQYFSNGSGDR